MALISGLFYWRFSHTIPTASSLASQLPESDQATTKSTKSDLDELVTMQVKSTSVKSSYSNSNRNLATRKRLKFYGRVIDETAQPIENVLISEEHFFYSTRTDSNGRYEITLEMPIHRFPVLQFLSGGFSSKRIEITDQELNQLRFKQLDVVLTRTFNSVTVTGWIGNDYGAGLEGAKIKLAPTNSQSKDGIYLTLFSDEVGHFSLDGINADIGYRLSAYATPEYSSYENLDFVATRNPKQLNIILDSLKFIDIDGMIVNREGTPIPDFELYLTNVSTGTHVKKIVSDSSGFFALRNFPVGEVSLSTRGPEYFKISGLILSETSYGSLMLVVDKGDHYLSGWVSDVNNIAVAKAMVTLDSITNNGPIKYISYRPKSTDFAGNFWFDNIGSGTHLITVYAPGFGKQEIMHSFKSQSDEIHITLSRID